MAGHQAVRRIHVLMLDPALRQHVFLFLLQHRELADFMQVTGEVALTSKRRDIAAGNDIFGHGMDPLYSLKT